MSCFMKTLQNAKRDTVHKAFKPSLKTLNIYNNFKTVKEDVEVSATTFKQS